jgi:hypothetical protein
VTAVHFNLLFIGLFISFENALSLSIIHYSGTVCQDSFWAKIRQNSTAQKTVWRYRFRYTCAGV